MNFPKLYSKNSNGSINEWAISVESNTITIRFGQVGGAIQTAKDVIREGKNLGKKNETTPAQQAAKEAKSRWTKQKKLGYVEKLNDAHNDIVDTSVIQGGVEPMLAQTFATMVNGVIKVKHANKIVYPAYVQPKLDGMRCLAQVKTENGRTSCTLWTRTRKPINSMPHIVTALESQFSGQTVTLDGELYNHELHADFEELIHLIRGDEPVPGGEIVQYHIYDVVMANLPYSERLAWLTKNMVPHSNLATTHLRLVETLTVKSYDDVWTAHDHFAELLYEGAIVRNAFGTYVGNRSMNLQKLKVFMEEEFKIVGCEEGEGGLAGHIGAFICEIPGDTFRTSMDGKRSRLKAWFTKRDWMGKMLTVRFQNYTKDKKPRFPKGKAIRDYE